MGYNDSDKYHMCDNKQHKICDEGYSCTQIGSKGSILAYCKNKKNNWIWKMKNFKEKKWQKNA